MTGLAPARRRRGPLGPRARRWAGLGAVGIAALVLSGCQIPAFGAFKGSTTQGQSAFKLWQGFFIAGAVIFVIVFALIMWAVLRYRRKSDAIPAQFQYHTTFEVFYTVVPIVIVMVLFVFTFIVENQVDAVTASPVTVNVTAFQWGWEFQYPKYDVKVLGIETQNPEMVVPANESVHIFLRSVDVIHGFYVPQFNFSRYALPGVTNQFDLNITHTGTFRGQCTQFCGLYHSLMLFRVKAVTSSQFTSWIHQEQRTPSTSGSIAKAKREILGGKAS
jgi:cytochrome c oxidase subunit II